MALNINGQESPKAINFNGQDVKLLVVDEIAIWQKPFTLTMSSDENSTLIVNRISSLNPDATIGNLSNGATIYYNDKLEVTTSFNDGYKFETLTINGTFWSEDPGIKTITVISDQTISLTSVASVGWKSIVGSVHLDGDYNIDLTKFDIVTEDLEYNGIADMTKEIDTGIYVGDKFSSGTDLCIFTEIMMDYNSDAVYKRYQIDEYGRVTESSINTHIIPYEEEGYTYNDKGLGFFYENYTIQNGYLRLRFRWVYDHGDPGYTVDTAPYATNMRIMYLAYWG